MDTKHKETYKIKRQNHTVSQKSKEQLKAYNLKKKKIIDNLTGKKLTIPELAKLCGYSEKETLYLVMSLLKFGDIQVSGIDDMDEYYYYKIKE